ncbi:carboxypeptidase-like regulatory domain-containing protein [Thiohalomonas denitrificans]|uniref:carboxypeptidase-like regulatory domain-containing protein n=1 Tax=Thiohalomonas denitrificans TaxID=415747 RepID=UPI0026F22D0D|nr:carboxypeptidase-like regulatory domain-containing protein [Thiohalomonas denitrificans]
MRWFALFLLLFLEPAWAFTAPVVRIEVTVTDESGAPVPDARVGAVYYGATDHYTDVELTDEKGIAVVSGRTVYAVPFSVSKLGYYPGGKKIMPPADETEAGLKKVAVVLRKKRNSIPLYAIKYSGEIPVAEEWVGFDLQKADWVSPFGKGVFSDLLLRYEGEFLGIDNARGELKLRFPNDGDGMRQTDRLYPESSFKTPYEAPVGGYHLKAMKWFQAIGYDMDQKLVPNEAKTYFFRIRTVTSKEGEIESALYGKLYGDIQYSLRSLRGGVSSIKFMYYLNPTPNDRNLEFAVGENLFKDLKHEQQVREP